MGKRLFRWFVFNVVFALFPLVMAILFRDLAGSLTADEIARSPEILFFALMVSATALGDLGEVVPSIGWDWLLGSLTAVLLVGAVLAATLYGALLYDSIQVIGPKFRSGLLNYSIVLAACLFIVGTVTEVMLGRIGVNK